MTMLDHAEKCLDRFRDDEGGAGCFGLLLGMFQSTGPLDIAKGCMDDQQLRGRNDIKQLDQHRLAVFAARMVGDEQCAPLDKRLDL
jgi:hypothetical protein